jgi:16S rRNA processing protein RimM
VSEPPAARRASAAAPQYVTIGTVASPHGLRGEVRVHPHTDYPQRFLALRRVYLGTNGRAEDLRDVERALVRPRDVILKLSGADSREAAGLLRGRDLLVPRDEIWPLPEGAYYHFQLLGLGVYDLAGRRRGVLTRIYPGPANDCYAVAETAGGPETLLPAIRSVIRSIDLAGARITVDWPKEEEPGPRGDGGQERDAR